MRAGVLGGYIGVVVTTGATVEESLDSFLLAPLWSRITTTTHRIVAGMWN